MWLLFSIGLKVTIIHSLAIINYIDAMKVSPLLAAQIGSHRNEYSVRCLMQSLSRYFPLCLQIHVCNTARYPQHRKQLSVVWSHFKPSAQISSRKKRKRVDMQGLLIKLGVTTAISPLLRRSQPFCTSPIDALAWWKLHDSRFP